MLLPSYPYQPAGSYRSLGPEWSTIWIAVKFRQT